MKEVPEAVRHLRLCRSFRHLQQKVEDCIEVTTEPLFYIEDNPETNSTVITSHPEEDKICKVYNPSTGEAVVLSIDHKLINNRAGGIADGAVFNTDNFHFVEFKTNAMGHTVGAVSATYTKAISQIKAAIEVFTFSLHTSGINFQDQVEVECHVVVSESFPRNKAEEMTFALLFAQETNGIPLYFDNEIELH